MVQPVIKTLTVKIEMLHIQSDNVHKHNYRTTSHACFNVKETRNAKKSLLACVMKNFQTMQSMKELPSEFQYMYNTMKPNRISKYIGEADSIVIDNDLALVPTHAMNKNGVDLTVGNLAVLHKDGNQFNTHYPAMCCETANDENESFVLNAYAYPRSQHTKLSFHSLLFVHDAKSIPHIIKNKDVYVDTSLRMQKDTVSFGDRRKWCKLKHMEMMDQVGLHIPDFTNTNTRHVASGVIECSSVIGEKNVTSFYFPSV